MRVSSEWTRRSRSRHQAVQQGQGAQAAGEVQLG